MNNSFNLEKDVKKPSYTELNLSNSKINQISGSVIHVTVNNFMTVEESKQNKTSKSDIKDNKNISKKF